ncbi:MAG: PorT family protein [Chlorobi bacterium]|nr:PorT family protein [Chlorobiota bacterium]
MHNRFLHIGLFFLLAALPFGLHAQIIKGEAILGMNLTQVDGDEVYGFHKFGLNLGGGVLIPFDKKGKWDVGMELIYTQKGSYQRPQYNEVDTLGNVLTGEYKVKLNYVEIPVLVMFTDRERVSFGAGFSYGQLFGVKEWEHGNLVDSTTLNSGTYKKPDFSVLADFRIRLWKGLKLNFRYQYSLLKIRTREFENLYTGEKWTRNQYNNVITFRLIWVFNEQKSREYFNQAE